ncbi:MAG: hypothetical protein H0X31_07685 [Nostocaceae cyanobacterium]|nr:hypothetical protein [Nostocaceae cyanobacterium]
MEIVQENPNLLALRQRPIGFWIMGGIFLAVGVFIPQTFGLVTTFTCNRAKSANCQLVTSRLLGAQSKQIPLNILQGAKVEKDNDAEGNSYRVVIFTSNGDVPFTF